MEIVLTALLILVQLADIYTTHRFLKRGIREGNPLARRLFKLIGFWPTCFAKLLLTAPMIFFVWNWPQYLFIPGAGLAVIAVAVWGNIQALNE